MIKALETSEHVTVMYPPHNGIDSLLCNAILLLSASQTMAIHRVSVPGHYDPPAVASRLRSCFLKSWHRPSITFCRRTMLASSAGPNWSLMMLPASSAASLHGQATTTVLCKRHLWCLHPFQVLRDLLFAPSATQEHYHCWHTGRVVRRTHHGSNGCPPAGSCRLAELVGDVVQSRHPGVCQPSHDAHSCEALRLQAQSRHRRGDSSAQVVRFPQTHGCTVLLQQLLVAVTGRADLTCGQHGSMQVIKPVCCIAILRKSS